MQNSIDYEDITRMKVISDFYVLFNKITGLILDINDKNGYHPKKFYTESKENKFCRIIKSNEIGESECIKCGRLLGIKAAKQKKPAIVECHAGLTELIYPIIINNELKAILESGQILIKKPSVEHFNEIASRVGYYGIDLNKLKKEYFKTKVIKKNVLMNYIGLMGLVVSYIIESEDKIIGLKKIENESTIFKAKEYIKENYSKRISVKDISTFLNISNSYFEHLFTKETGMTFIEYLNYHRISVAKKMLITKPISFVCYEVGFGSLSHFYKFFKRSTGCSPKEYEREIKNKMFSN
jgi:AraC-like DNA-binding protein/ligand-binding sensor protein